jgi:hypothetical protein
MIAQLAGLLSKSGHQRVALYRLGGTGYVPILVWNTYFLANSCKIKTQVTLEYVYRQIDTEPGCRIFWVNDGGWTTFSRDYRNISIRLGLLVSDTEEDETFLQLNNWLGSKASSDWILIVQITHPNLDS